VWGIEGGERGDGLGALSAILEIMGRGTRQVFACGQSKCQQDCFTQKKRSGGEKNYNEGLVQTSEGSEEQAFRVVRENLCPYRAGSGFLISLRAELKP